MDAGSINYLYSTDIIYETPKANNVLYINYFIHQLGIHGNRKKWNIPLKNSQRVKNSLMYALLLQTSNVCQH